MALDLNKLVSTAAKVAVGAAEVGKEVIGGVVSGVKEGIENGKSERASEDTPSPKDTRCEELLERLPFLKASEAKVAEVLSAHPERKSLWFRLPDSVTDGVVFNDPEGNEAYVIRKGDGNLRKIVSSFFRVTPVSLRAAHETAAETAIPNPAISQVIRPFRIIHRTKQRINTLPASTVIPVYFPVNCIVKWYKMQ